MISVTIRTTTQIYYIEIKCTWGNTGQLINNYGLIPQHAFYRISMNKTTNLFSLQKQQTFTNKKQINNNSPALM